MCSSDLVYSLINYMPAIVARGLEVERTLRHAILRFWRPLFPATILEVAVDGPRFAIPATTNDPAADRSPATVTRPPAADEPSLPWIDALAGRNDSGAWLLLTNRHPTETLTVELPGAFAGATVDRLLPENNNLAFRVQDGGETAAATLDLPAWSHARLRAKGGEK